MEAELQKAWKLQRTQWHIDRVYNISLLLHCVTQHCKYKMSHTGDKSFYAVFVQKQFPVWAQDLPAFSS